MLIFVGRPENVHGVGVATAEDDGESNRFHGNKPAGNPLSSMRCTSLHGMSRVWSVSNFPIVQQLQSIIAVTLANTPSTPKKSLRSGLAIADRSFPFDFLVQVRRSRSALSIANVLPLAVSPVSKHGLAFRAVVMSAVGARFPVHE